ncbi:MAG: 4'-phosphopantetheinyl transferase family protein [Phycisphaerales bacterium JB060]
MAPTVDRAAVSLSRTDDIAMCAVTQADAIGVDVERLRPWRELVDMAPLLSDQPPENARDLLLLWTRKEALAKAMGVGLPDDVRGLRVPVHSPGICEWLRRDGWLWIGCPCEKGAVASLVVRHEGDDTEGTYDMIELREKPSMRGWSIDLPC